MLDVDVADGKKGDIALAALEHEHGPLPATVTAITGTGGRHYFFAWPAGIDVRNNQSGKLGPGLDVRGDGGQVVAAPTVHPNGTPYAWTDGCSPDQIAVAPAPAWLLELLTAEPEPPRAPTIARPPAAVDDEDSIAAWFNDTTTWDELLTRDGWTRGRDVGVEQMWTRAGKTVREGNSATVNYKDTDTLKVFTSSVPNLYESGPRDRAATAYSRFDYEVAVRFNEDSSAAAAAMRRRRNELEGKTRQPEDWSIYILPGSSLELPEPIDPADVDAPDEWADPKPLEAALSHGPPFPVDVLPDWIRRQVDAVTRSFQVPPDLPAMLALGALSVATMGRIKVVLTGSRWTEHTNIYAVCAMPPGAGKSPVYKAMTRVLVDLQTELMDQAAKTVREAEARKELLERKAKAAFDKAAKLDATQADMLQAVDLRAQAEETEIPPKPRLLAEDTTPEALVLLMSQHGGRMALLSSEGGIFDMMAGQYAERGKTANLAVYLQGWSGDAITQDRIGRTHIRIAEALLTICVTTQPKVLARLGENPELAGRGLPVRFMFSVPPSNVGARDRYAVLRDVDPRVQKTYDGTIHELGLDLAKYARAADLALTIEARDLFLAWDQDLEHRQAPGRDLELLAEWISKLRATVLRLAGILHVADGGTVHDDIDADVMARALAIAGYWLDHARAVHETWAANADPVKGAARSIVTWATKEGISSFTASELQKNLRRQFERIADVVDPLELLVSAGWLRAESGLPVKVGQPGKPSPRFTLHPAAADHLANGAQPAMTSAGGPGANGAQPVDGAPDEAEASRHSGFARIGGYQDLPTYISPLYPPVQSANGAKPESGGSGPPSGANGAQPNVSADTTEEPWTLI